MWSHMQHLRWMPDLSRNQRNPGSDGNLWPSGSLDDRLLHAAQHSMDARDGVLISVLDG